MPPQPWKDPAIEITDLLKKVLAGNKRIETGQKALTKALSAISKGMKKLSEDLTKDTALLRGDEAAIKASIGKAVARMNDLATQLAEAIAKAGTAGATPEQLQALTDLHTDLAADASELDAAATPPAEEQPAPEPQPE